MSDPQSTPAADTPVITRFAPSPTGHLHIGGARTALFCAAYARGPGGRFVLPREDTDQKRSSEAAAAGILDDLAWLGIDWDDGPEHGLQDGQDTLGGDDRGVGPFYQSRRRAHYDRYLQQLIDAGHAYPAFETPEELGAMRKAAEAEKKTFIYRQAPGYDHAAALEAMNVIRKRFGADGGVQRPNDEPESPSPGKQP